MKIGGIGSEGGGKMLFGQQTGGIEAAANKFSIEKLFEDIYKLILNFKIEI